MDPLTVEFFQMEGRTDGQTNGREFNITLAEVISELVQPREFVITQYSTRLVFWGCVCILFTFVTFDMVRSCVCLCVCPSTTFLFTAQLTKFCVYLQQIWQEASFGKYLYLIVPFDFLLQGRYSRTLVVLGIKIGITLRPLSCISFGIISYSQSVTLVRHLS